MPHGAPPPQAAPADDDTQFPPDDRIDSQTATLAGVALAAGASTPIAIREDYGITDVIVGLDVAGSISIDYVPLLVPAGDSKDYHFAEPVMNTGQPHQVTNTGVATIHVSLFAVGKQRRIHHARPSPSSHASSNGEGSRPAEALTY